MPSPPSILRVRPDNGPWPLHDRAATRLAEHHALAAAEPHGLMEQAGLAVAKLALALSPHAQLLRLWCGPGNNGGDGLVAARRLHLQGQRVQVILVADSSRLPSDAAHALHSATAAGVAVQSDPTSAEEPDLEIDALLGIGAARAPQGALARAVERINNAGRPVLAVDLPSGLQPDTGSLLGEQAVRAQTTLSLLTLKPGCFTGHGRDHAGAVWLDRLGNNGAALAAPNVWLATSPGKLSRPHSAHKGSHGDVAVVGGAMGMVGAAWLAAGAALAAGAGRVTCSLLAGGSAVPPGQRPELLTREQWWRQPQPVLAGSTVVCGCGGGDQIRLVLPILLSHAGRLLLDADALNTIAADTPLQQLLLARADKGLPTVLTPHPLEAGRMLGISAAQVQSDRIRWATALSERFAATVLLKGSGSVIAAPGQLPVINSTGNAALATAGTGDVLAGWAGGLWAQQPAAMPQWVAAAAAWQHGTAADQFTLNHPGQPLRAAALIEAMVRCG